MNKRFHVFKKQPTRQSSHIAIKRRRKSVDEIAAPIQKTAQSFAGKDEQAVNPDEVLTNMDVREIKKLVNYYEATIDYMIMRNKPSRVVSINVLAGMAKGFGFALGVTVLGFLALKILMSLQLLNLPVIGDFIADLIDYIQSVQKIGVSG